MKQTLVFLLMAFVVMSCSEKTNQKGKTVLLKGNVRGTTEQQIRFARIVDNSISNIEEDYEVKLDESSNFSIEIPIEGLANGILVVGKYYFNLSLIPGDNMFIQVEENMIHFKGKGAEKNNFLYDIDKKSLGRSAYYEEYNKINLAPLFFLGQINRVKQQRLETINAFTDTLEIQKDFVDYFKIETQVIYQHLLQSYPNRYSYRKNIPIDALKLDDEFKSVEHLSSIADDKNVVSASYIINIGNILSKKSFEMARTNPDVSREEAYVMLLDSLPEKTREYVCAKNISSNLPRGIYDTALIDKFKLMGADELATRTFDEAMAKYEEKQALIGERLHPEFSKTALIDAKGEKISFGEMMDSYKGEVVYLDLWSMSCSSCKAAMPYGKILKDKLKDQPIKFVYLTIDRIKNNDWSSLYEATLTSENHFALENGYNSRLQTFMEINWIPNYMIFDKKGRLVDFNAKRPTKEIQELEETDLEKMLKELALS